jgi:hypothetical protein
MKRPEFFAGNIPFFTELMTDSEGNVLIFISHENGSNLGFWRYGPAGDGPAGDAMRSFSEFQFYSCVLVVESRLQVPGNL